VTGGEKKGGKCIEGKRKDERQQRKKEARKGMRECMNQLFRTSEATK